MSDARLDQLTEQLNAIDQGHVLRFVDELDGGQREHLLDQIESLDFDALPGLIESHVRSRPDAAAPRDLEPAECVAHATEAAGTKAREHHAAGESLIREGKLAAFTVAGGQGTRLGWNGPKGTFPATPVTGKPLFAVFAEQIRAAQDRYGVTIPWYIMTSPINDAATRGFFRDNNCFGLRRSNIFMFPQGMMPSFGIATAKMLLADKHDLALSPDGHGGSLKALRVNGAIDDMLSRGIEHISYFQVDNPLVQVIDPAFLGLHANANESSAQISSKMVAKRHAAEKVGVFCTSGGRMMVIEYSDLPQELAEQTNADGSLRFNAGSIAVHLMSVAFVKQLTDDAAKFALPYHRAEKKVEHIDLDTGERITPSEPNAVKLETFVFDAIPLAERSIVYETRRAHEFAPIKNAEGDDSARSSRQLQSDHFATWLEDRGREVPRDAEGHVLARIEVSPLTATCPQELPDAKLPDVIRADADIAL